MKDRYYKIFRVLPSGQMVSSWVNNELTRDPSDEVMLHYKYGEVTTANPKSRGVYVFPSLARALGCVPGDVCTDVPCSVEIRIVHGIEEVVCPRVFKVADPKHDTPYETGGKHYGCRTFKAVEVGRRVLTKHFVGAIVNDKGCIRRNLV